MEIYIARISCEFNSRETVVTLLGICMYIPLFYKIYMCIQYVFCSHLYVQTFNDTLNVARIERRVKNRFPAIHNIHRATNGTSDPSAIYIYIYIYSIGKYEIFNEVSNVWFVSYIAIIKPHLNYKYSAFNFFKLTELNKYN